ncbi:methyl-accepting chemotaxis protein [Marinobacter oulmenensis]|uniref:Methyl-accepting chemotaxis protein n=1 Tax=Marinobacter oulmenensis TaxID=643747 RepID=A0A840UA90_9GAMM|nr:methyl-accepting chemotaxis protein [Marinobacter oulmenensis]MBB5322049.1 methyl-accepting chemotaxis protein [Marinobacter oulmenensis]
MNVIKNLGFRTKIALPFAITAIALIVVGVFSVMTARNLVSDTERTASVYLPSVSEILNGDRDLYQALVAQMSIIDLASSGDSSDQSFKDFNENADQARRRYEESIERLAGTGVAEHTEGFTQAFNRWRQSATKVIELARDGAPQQARRLARSETDALFGELRNYFDKAGAHADEQAQNRAASAAADGLASSTTVLVITVIALILSVILFIVFLRLIIQSIGTLRAQLDDIADGEGDLTKRIPVTKQDDLGTLSHSFNRVLENLQSMIGSIQSLSRDLGAESTHLATSARDNSEGVTKQTDSITMVATAINEMQSAIEEVAGNASRAAELTRNAETKGNNGARIIQGSSEQVRQLATRIGEAVDVIRKLSTDSDNITSVLDVIRGIAEQTNLLALNAAIEAARAGEQGRGFAVVADEVRTLAQRTQKSTEDIQSMISTLQSGVTEVVDIMEVSGKEATATEKSSEEADQELRAILEAISDIADVNTSVASATEEQTQVIDEINRSITDINDLAAASADRSQAIDGISKSLEEYASQLESQTGRFRV